MNPKFKKTATKKYRKPKTSKPKPSAPLVQAVRQVAKAEVLRQAETKFSHELVLPSTGVLQYINTPAQAYGILPTVFQGTGDEQRIGTKIHPVKARTHFTFYFLSSQSSAAWNQDLEVNFMIVKAKGYDSSAAKLSIPPNSLLKTGLGINIDPDLAGLGNQQTALTDKNMLPVNTDLYTVLLRKTFVMRKGIGNQNSAPSGVEVAPTGVPAHEDCYKFTYEWVPPVLEYNSVADSLPQAHNPIALCWQTNRDASANFPNVLFWAASSDLFFKDI
jgi:hypothetical protein